MVLDIHKKPKTKGRKVINGYKCVKFMSRGRIVIERPAQLVAQRQPREALHDKVDSVASTEKGREPILLLLMTSPRSRSTS